jgi:hypothetical protein
MTECVQAPLKQEVGFIFLGRDQPDDILVQARGGGIRLDIGYKAVFVLAIG